MTNLDEFLVIFISVVVLIGTGWFVYNANRNDKE